MPITFSDEELALLQALAAPINQRHRHQFLTEVTAGLEAAARETGVAPDLAACTASGGWSSGAYGIRRRLSESE